MIPGVGGLHGRQKRALVGRLGKTVMNQRIVCPTETAAAFKTDRYPSTMNIGAESAAGMTQPPNRRFSFLKKDDRVARETTWTSS